MVVHGILKSMNLEMLGLSVVVVIALVVVKLKITIIAYFKEITMDLL